MLSRLLNSSPEQTESESWRVGGLSIDNESVTAEVILGDRDSQTSSQRGQQQDKPAEVYEALASSGPTRKGSLKGEVGEGVMTGLDVWLPGHQSSILHHDNEQLSSPRTGKDCGHFIKGDEVDSYAWSTRSREGQRVSKGSFAERSLDSDESTGGDSSILGGDKGATTERSSKFSSGEGSMKAVEDRSPGRALGRGAARQPSTTPAQHTMVCCAVFALNKCYYLLAFDCQLSTSLPFDFYSTKHFT